MADIELNDYVDGLTANPSLAGTDEMYIVKAGVPYNVTLTSLDDRFIVVDSVNGATGVVVLDPDDLDDTSTTHKFISQAELDKLAGIEDGADVVDATNVAAAGALMAGNNLSDIPDDATARVNLGLGDLAVLDVVEISDINAAGTPGSGNFLRGDGTWTAPEGGGDMQSANNLSDVVDVAEARTNLGLGTAALAATGDFEASGAVSTHNAVTTAHGISAFGASLVDDADAAAARTTLGLGSLATESGVAISEIEATGTPGSGNFLRGDGSWQAVPGGGDLLAANNLSDLANAGTARTNLGLGSLATASTVNNDVWSGADLAVVNGGTGASDAGTARTNLGLGSLATASTINDDNWSGADLSVANGGTGASNAASARTNLGIVSATDSAEGLVELATTAETQTGTDTARAVTPAGASATYLPLPTGTATAGQVPVATGTGNASAWGTPSAGGGLPPTGASSAGWAAPGMVRFQFSNNIITPAANRTYYVGPYVHGGLTLSSVSININAITGTANVRLAIVEMDPDSMQPTGVVVDVPEQTYTTPGEKSISVGPVDIPAGQYMVGLRTDNSTVQLKGMLAGSILGWRGSEHGFRTASHFYVNETYGAWGSPPTAWTTYENSTGSGLTHFLMWGVS